MGEGRAPFPPMLLRANRASSEELFLNPAVLIVRAKGLFVYPFPYLQQYGLSIASQSFSAGFKCSRAEKKKSRGKKNDAFPPALIICGAGVTWTGATGAYKDLCAGKGIRLQPRNEWGRSALAQCAERGASAMFPRRWVGSAIPVRWSLAASELGRFARSGKAGNLSSFLASPHPGPARAEILPRKRPN